MADKIDINLKLEAYSDEMKKLSLKQEALEKEIKELEKEKAGKYGRFGKDIGKVSDPQKAEEIKKERLSAENKKLEKLQKELDELEKKQIVQRNKLLEQEIDEKKSEIKERERVFKKKQEEKYSAYTFSQAEYEKKIAAQEEELIKKQEELVKLKTEINNKRKKDLDEQIKQVRKQTATVKKTHSAYEGYSFEPLAKSDLEEIQKDFKKGILKKQDDLLKRLPKGRTIPLEEMQLFEGKKSTGGRAHDYLEAGTTKEKYGDLFKDIRTISITQSGKILFGDKYPTKEERQGYVEQFKKEKQALEKSIPKDASYAQLISVTSKIESLKKQIEEQEAEIKKLDEGTYTAQGTAFHSFAEMFGRGKLPLLKDLLKSGGEKNIAQAKDIILRYFKVGSVDDLMALKDTGFTDNDREMAEEFFDKLQNYRGIVGSNRATSYMTSGLKSYEDFLTKHGISEAEAVEKSIGFITNIDDELVKFVGTVDALFSNFLIDLKTGELHPAEVAWQTNLGAFIEEMVSGVKHEKLGAFKPGSTYEDSFFLPISKMPPKLIKQLLVEAARGQRTTENVGKYAQSTFEQRMVKGKDDEDRLATFINKKRLPIATYETEKPKTQSGIDKIQREAEELVDSIKSLKIDDMEHVLNQIYSIADYTSKTSTSSSSFYRSGYFWDTVREKLPYDISKVLNYAMGADESVLPKSSGVGTRTYRIQDGDQIQEIDVPTVLGVTLKEWVKLANVLSEMPDGAEKVKRLVDVFEKEFKEFDQNDQRRILKSFQNMATSDGFLSKEYSKLLKDKQYLETQLSIYKDGEKSEKLNAELTEIQQKISEFEKNGVFNPYETFEKAWEESSDFLSRKNKQFLLETLDDYRSVKYETTDDSARGRYAPEVDPYEDMYDEDDFHYKGGEAVGKSPDEKAELLGNQLARIFDYSTRVDKIFAAKAREMGVPVEDLSKSVLRDFAETTGSQDEFNRYVRSKGLQQSFQAQFPNFKGKIEDDVLDWILSKLDENISEEKKVLSGWAGILEEGPVTRGKLRNGKIVSKKTIIPSQELKDVAGRRIFNTLYSDKESAALEVMDDLLHGKTHEFTKTTKPNIEWAEAFLNYDELLPDANNILEQYVSARAELEAATKEFNFQNLSQSNIGSKDWEKAQEALEKAKTKVQDILTLSRKTFKSGLVSGYDPKDITNYLQEKEAEAAEEKRQQYISSAAMWAYRGTDPSKTKLSQQEIDEYLKFNAEQFGISTEDLLGEYRKENVYMPFYKFLQNKAGKEGIKFQAFSPKKIAQTIVDTAAPVVSDAVAPAVSQAVEDMVVVGVPEAVSDITAEQLPPEQVQEEVRKAVLKKAKKKDVKTKTVTITPQPAAAKKKKPKYKQIVNQIQSTGGIQSVYATSDDIADLSKTKATSITTDYEGHTIGKTYKYLADKVFADYGPGGLAGWIDKARRQGIDASKTELIDILTKVPSYKKASGGLSKAGRTAFDEIMTDAFGDKYQPQSGSGAILSELKGIHKDTSSIEVKVGLGGTSAPSTMAAVTPTGTTSQTISRTTRVKPTDKVKSYLKYSKAISNLQVKQRKEESSSGKIEYEKIIEAYQKLQKDLGDFTDAEKLLIQEKEKEIERNQQLKLSEVEIAAAKKQTKQGAKEAAQVEKDWQKSEKDSIAEASKTARDYQKYLDQRFSILSKIEAAQAQYNISTGKEKIAAEGVVAQRKIELDYLDQKNSDLIETMATTQKSTKLDMDYAQSLRVASMQQEKLLGKKGAASIWDVMANDIKRATMRVADFGIAAKVMNKIPQDIQKVIQYTKELDAAMTNIRIVGGYNEEQAKSLMRSYTELGKTLGATTVEVATAANEWLRQGYEAEDQLKELISASTKLSKLGMISASEATTALTSALKSFNLTAEDAIDVVDKLTKVDQLAAVSAGGIATALQKSATSAKLAGMSMDELIGSVSVIGEVTQQSMDTVGNAMKSILARYGNVKASVFTQMGLNDEGETSENINDIEKVLSKLGIRMRSSSTELRDITDVLDEVNEKWDTYDTVTKNALATAFGGTRMRENFLVLMENWDRVKELTEESANAAGTADEKYSAYMDSMEAATKRLQNAWEGFTQSLATSTIMKTLTNAVAFLVENADKLKYVITYITAVSSSKIFDFFTNKGETGGFKGLIANIPFLGRGTKTNNILESIDRKVGDIRGEVKKDKTTKNGGFFGRWITGIAQYKQDKQRIEKDAIQAATMAASKEAYLSQAQKVNILRLQSEAMGGPLADFDEMQEAQAISQQYEEEKKILQEKRQQYKAQGAISKANAEEVKISKERIAKQKRSRLTTFKQTAIASGLTTALTQLLTDKTIGSGVSGWIGKQLAGIGDNEQVMSETAAGKAARVGLSTAGAVAGATTALIPVIGPMIAPIASSVGSIAGEGLASIISTIVHRSELEMKQRVADAKENSKALTSINNSVSENSSLMKETFLDSSSVKNLSKYVDELSEKLGELSNDALSEFLSTVSTSTEKFKTISDLSNYILEANAEERKEIQQRIEVVTAKEQLKQTIASQEEERYKIAQAQNKQISPDYLNISYKDAAWSTPRYAPYFEALQKYTDLSDTTGISAGAHQAGDFSIKGRTAREQLSNLQSLIEEVRQSVDKANAEFSASYIKKLLKQLEDYEKELGDAVKAQDKLDAALIKSRVQVAFFQANLSDLTQSELQNLTIDGVAGKVVEALEKDGVAVRDLSGTIKDDYLTQIKLAIKSDEDLYSQLQTDTKSIGELMEVRSKFIQQFGEDYDEVREQLDKGKLDYLSDDLKGLIYSADPERIKQFAQAWHIATSEVENFAKRFPNLNTATGLMSVDEVKDKYTKIAEIFSDISQDRTLSIENFENILKNYPEYLSKIGDYEGLMGSLIGSIGEESAEAYKNALFTDIMSSENYLAEFKKTLSDKDIKTIEEAGAKSFEDIYQLAQGKEELKGITEALDEYLNKVIEVENESPLKDFMIELKSGLLDEEINNLNEQKDALSKINDERKKEIEYIKAKYALEDARKEKKRVFRAGVGWTYESDEAAISEAKEKVDSLDLERQQESLQYQIDSLEQQKEILEAIKNNEQLKKIEEALGANGISTDTADIAMMLAQSLKLDLGERTKGYKTALSEKAKGLEKNVDTALQAYQTALKKFTEGDENGQKWENWNQAVRKNKLENLSSLYSEYQKAYDAAQSFGVKNMERWSEDGKIIPNAAESDKYSIDRIVVNGLGRHFLDWFKDDIKLRVGDKEFAAELSNSNMTVTQKELNEAYGQSPVKGDVFSYGEKYYVYRGDEWWEVLNDKGGTKFYEYMTGTPTNASGTTSFPGGQTLINELGTEAVITPGGTLTALPSKTGIVPADITRNVWALGEVAPTLIARLGSLTQKPLAGNGANTTYEEGQYIDNLTMNVYPAKGDDFNKILEQARAQVRLTRRNN